MRMGLLLLALILPAGRGSAQLELKVGRDAISWVEIQDSLSFVNVSTDSAWTWRVEPGENLMANVLGRGGRILLAITEELLDFLESDTN